MPRDRKPRPCAHLNVTISGGDGAFSSVAAVYYPISGICGVQRVQHLALGLVFRGHLSGLGTGSACCCGLPVPVAADASLFQVSIGPWHVFRTLYAPFCWLSIGYLSLWNWNNSFIYLFIFWIKVSIRHSWPFASLSGAEWLTKNCISTEHYRCFYTFSTLGHCLDSTVEQEQLFT